MRCLAVTLAAFTFACASNVRVLDPLPSEPAIAALNQTIPVDIYTPHTFRSREGIDIPYRLLRPAVPSRTLLVIFHGSGAIGTDNRAQIGGMARSWATGAMRRDYPAYVLVPQMPARSANYEADERVGQRSFGTPTLEAALELIEQLRTTEHIDRVYAIGFSMGGSSVWNTLVLKPGLLAKGVVIAGVPNPQALPLLGDTRLLLVHGDADTENPFDAAWATYHLAPRRLEFWRYRGLGHDVPAQLLNTTALAEWLFTNRSDL
ncbi:MAG TPA: hypothetical protein VF618_22660 [Thermoanaerobaculia bacterium]